MRYFFAPELEWYLADAGFEPLWSGEFLTERPLDEHTWNALFLARKRQELRTGPHRDDRHVIVHSGPSRGLSREAPDIDSYSANSYRLWTSDQTR